MAGGSQETYGRSSPQLELPARLAKNTGTHPLLKPLSFSYVSTANFVKTSLELAPVFARVAHLAAIWSTSASSSFSGTYPGTYAKKRCERKIRQPRLFIQTSNRPTEPEGPNQNSGLESRSYTHVSKNTQGQPAGKANKILLQRSLRNPLPWTWFPPNRSGTTFRPCRSLHR